MHYDFDIFVQKRKQCTSWSFHICDILTFGTSKAWVSSKNHRISLNA